MNKKNKHIFIIGMMGSGKSSLAPVLSKKLKTPFIDTDADLTSILKLDTEEIFTTFSEEKFRILESTYFLEHIKNSQHIYATGGGIIINKKNRDALHSFGTTILLQAPIDVIYARLIKQVEQSRPLFMHSPNQKSIEDIWDKRKKHYTGCADLIINIKNKSLATIADEVIGFINT